MKEKNNNSLFQNIVQFFQALFPDQKEGYLELRAIKEGKPIITRFLPLPIFEIGLEKFISEMNQNYNCYFGLSLRETENNGKKENCFLLPCLYADVDYGSEGHKKKSLFETQEKALEHIKRFPIPPSIIVDSGHGLHLYWLLKDYLNLKENSIQEVEDLNKKIAHVLGGDDVQNVDRIFRIPHTYNVKSEPFLESVIIEFNPNRRYDFSYLKNEILSNPLFALNFKTLKKQSLLDMIFGNFENGCDDRSACDQSIITSLLMAKFNAEEIKTIFRYFPTTGKYHERYLENQCGADQYLDHSIMNAKDYLRHEEYDKRKNNSSHRESNSFYGAEIIRAGEEQGEIPSKSRSSNDDDDDDAINELISFNNDSESNEDRTFSNIYQIDRLSKDIGYYYVTTKQGETIRSRMSNFIIELDRQVITEIDKSPCTYLNGVVVTVNDAIPFIDMPASTLASPQKFKEQLLNICGVKVSFFAYDKHLMEAIKHFNFHIPTEVAAEFGYNKEFTEFVTPDFIIRADEVIEQKTPILFVEDASKNKLGFNLSPDMTLDSIVRVILDKLLQWDDPKVTYVGLAFTMLPVIYPFLRPYIDGKPYLVFKGITGCGKTTMSELFQNFFGEFQRLSSWSSTPTSISVTGHAYKDALFCVDDFKRQNFFHDSDVRKVMTLFQNYSDEHARDRANVNLKLRDERFIRGFMMVSAEDLVFTESSTIARGIIINMQKKEIKMAEKAELKKLSKDFSHFTLYLIQYLLANRNKINFEKAVKENQDYFISIVKKENLNGDNLPRIINNFALVRMAGQIIFPILCENNTAELSSHLLLFDESLSVLFVENYKRTENAKPDQKFIDTMFQMIENDLLKIENVKLFAEKEDKIIGYYDEENNDQYKIGIKYSRAYKLVNEYLRDEGGIGTSQETLKTMLTQSGVLETPNTGRITIGGKTFRGSYWKSEIPFNAFRTLENTQNLNSEACKQQSFNPQEDNLPF